MHRWNSSGTDSLGENVFSITIYNSYIYPWYIVFLHRVSKYLNYHDQRFNGELMRVVTGPFICGSWCMLNKTNQGNTGNWSNRILE